MRIKKAEKYKNECEEVTNKIIEIINLDSEKSFILYEFDRDT